MNTHLSAYGPTIIGAPLLLGAMLTAAGPPITQDTRVAEIRVYTLKSGTRDHFHQLFVQHAMPMLRRSNIDVVAYGPSWHDSDSYFLVRSFASLSDRARSEDAFYGSDEWKQGPREAVLAAIDTYSTVVVPLDDEALDGLRRVTSRSRAANRYQGDAMPETMSRDASVAADRTTLLKLNDDYIQAVQKSDVRRFEEILAGDFLCIMADGAQVDRDAFLKRIAAPATITHLEAHDVNVRIMGDVALVHARTTFRTADGRAGTGRYTDVWARRDGRWLAVAAHVSRY